MSYSPDCRFILASNNGDTFADALQYDVIIDVLDGPPNRSFLTGFSTTVSTNPLPQSVVRIMSSGMTVIGSVNTSNLVLSGTLQASNGIYGSGFSNLGNMTYTSNLTANYAYTHTHCNMGSMTTGGGLYSSNGIYGSGFSNVGSMTYTSNLTANYAYTQTHCNMGSMTIGGGLYASNEIYGSGFSNVGSMTYTSNLAANYAYTQTHCNMGGMTVGGGLYASNGIYGSGFSNVGCMTYTSNLAANYAYTQTHCNMGGMTVGGGLYSSNGIYGSGFSNVGSVTYTSNLTANYAYTQTHCNMGSMTIGSGLYASNGIYGSSFSNAGGATYTCNIFANNVNAVNLYGAISYSQITGTPASVTGLPYSAIIGAPFTSNGYNVFFASGASNLGLGTISPSQTCHIKGGNLMVENQGVDTVVVNAYNGNTYNGYYKVASWTQGFNAVMMHISISANRVDNLTSIDFKAQDTTCESQVWEGGLGSTSKIMMQTIANPNSSTIVNVYVYSQANSYAAITIKSGATGTPSYFTQYTTPVWVNEQTSPFSLANSTLIHDTSLNFSMQTRPAVVNFSNVNATTMVAGSFSNLGNTYLSGASNIGNTLYTSSVSNAGGMSVGQALIVGGGIYGTFFSNANGVTYASNIQGTSASYITINNTGSINSTGFSNVGGSVYTSNLSNAGNVSIAGTVIVGSSLTVVGNFSNLGSTYLFGASNVGNTFYTSTMSNAGNVSVGGVLTISSNLFVFGNLTVTNSEYVTSNIFSSNLMVNGILSNAGSVYFVGASNVNNTFYTSTLSNAGSLAVTGQTTLGATTATSLTMSGVLSNSGNKFFPGGSNVNNTFYTSTHSNAGGMSVGLALVANGGINATSVTAASVSTSNLTCTGTLNIPSGSIAYTSIANAPTIPTTLGQLSGTLAYSNVGNSPLSYTYPGTTATLNSTITSLGVGATVPLELCHISGGRLLIDNNNGTGNTLVSTISINYYSSSAADYSCWKLVSFPSNNNGYMCDIVGNFSRTDSQMDIDFKMMGTGYGPQCHSRYASSGATNWSKMVVENVASTSTSPSTTNVYITVSSYSFVNFTMRYSGFVFSSKPVFVDVPVINGSTKVYTFPYSTTAVVHDTSINASEYIYPGGITIPNLITTNTITANGGLTVAGNTTLNGTSTSNTGTLTVANLVTANGGLAVVGNTTLNGATSNVGTLTVANLVTANGRLAVAGNTTLNGAATSNTGTLTVTNLLTANGGVTVNGPLSAGSHTSMGTTQTAQNVLAIAGPDGFCDTTSWYGNVTLTTPTTTTVAMIGFIRSNNTVVGLGYAGGCNAFGFGSATNSNFSPTFLNFNSGAIAIAADPGNNISLKTSGGGIVSVTGLLSAQSGLGVATNGSTIIDSNGNGTFTTLSNSGNLYSSGFSNVGGSIYANSLNILGLASTPNATLASLSVNTGTTTVTGVAQLKGGLNVTGTNVTTVSGTTSLVGGLNVTAGNLTTVSGTTSLVGGLNVTTGNLTTVSGTTSLVGGLNVTAGNLTTVSGTTSLVGGLNVTTGNLTTISGTTSLVGGLTVTSGNLTTVSSNTSLVGGLTVTSGNLTTVLGGAQLVGGLTVSTGVTAVTGQAVVGSLTASAAATISGVINANGGIILPQGSTMSIGTTATPTCQLSIAGKDGAITTGSYGNVSIYTSMTSGYAMMGFIRVGANNVGLGYGSNTNAFGFGDNYTSDTNFYPNRMNFNSGTISIATGTGQSMNLTSATGSINIQTPQVNFNADSTPINLNSSGKINVNATNTLNLWTNISGYNGNNRINLDDAGITLQTIKQINVLTSQVYFNYTDTPINLSSSGQMNVTSTNILKLWTNISGYNGNNRINLDDSGITLFTTKNISMSCGFVGIGLTNPLYPLHIGIANAQQDNTESHSGYAYLIDRNDGNPTVGWVGTNNFDSPYISLKVDGAIVGNNVYAFSDKRVKKAIADIPDDMIDRFMNTIRPRMFKYIDTITNKDVMVSGFIAQELEGVTGIDLPSLVERHKGDIPSIMTLCTFVQDPQDVCNICVSGLTENTLTSLIVNTRLSLRDGSNKASHGTVEKIDVSKSEVSLRLDKGCDLSHETDKQIYVYGEEVDDFRIVDHKQIEAISFAAVQRLLREVKSMQEDARKQADIIKTYGELLKSQGDAIAAIQSSMQSSSK